VACLPSVAAAPLLAASLAHRLLAIGAELAAAFGSKLVARVESSSGRPAPQAEEVTTQQAGDAGSR
jgi:hypothetical protein